MLFLPATQFLKMALFKGAGTSEHFYSLLSDGPVENGKSFFCPVIPTCPDIGDVKSFAGMGESIERRWGKRKRTEGKSKLREK